MSAVSAAAVAATTGSGVQPSPTGGVRFLVDAMDVGTTQGAGAQGTELDEGAFDRDLASATFKDCRWQNAASFLRERGILEKREEVLALLRRGARSFGLWCVTEVALEGLLARILEEDSAAVSSAAREPSPALRHWLRACAPEGCSSAAAAAAAADPPAKLDLAAPPRRTGMDVRKSATITAQMVSDFTKRRWKLVSVRVRRLKLGMTLAIMALAVLIAAPWREGGGMYVCFGGGLAISRITGIGAIFWTALLFLSVSRTLLKMLYSRLPPRSVAAKHLDANHQIHMFCGKMVFLFGIIHTSAHLTCTYRIFSETHFEDLNKVLVCATSGQQAYAPGLEWPRCPLERNWGYMELVFSSTGLTGFGLIGVIALMAVTGAKSARSKNYEAFWIWHNIGLVLWMVLLFIHGSQGWFGIGIPLVVPFCSIPFACYLVDRVLRFARFYLFKGRVQIISAVIRPGKGGGAEGALTALQISKPPFLWSFRAGMYAYLNVPECSSWQWHPFTICSGRDDDTVDFIIAGVGDWTTALAQRCLDFQKEVRPSFPEIAIDGPYAAPATAAVCSQVLVAVGAGVGITPFLALMARVLPLLGDGGARSGDEAALKEVHFYWITRSADEFLFGRQHFTRIVSDLSLCGKVFLHLHLTFKEAKNDASAYVFREAVRRQSIVDRDAFLQATRDVPADALLASGAQVPWGWAHGMMSDVMWVRALVEASDRKTEIEIARAFTNHWAEGANVYRSGGRMASGPLLCRRSSASLRATSSAPTSGDDDDDDDVGGADDAGVGAVAVVEEEAGPPAEASPTRRRCGPSLWTQRRLCAAEALQQEAVVKEIVDERQALAEQPAVPEDAAERTVVVPMGDSASSVNGYRMLPLVIGRPDFAAEIQTIGKAWPDLDVDVFACGNLALVDSLRDICMVCSSRAAARAGASRAQRFTLRFEDFGS